MYAHIRICHAFYPVVRMHGSGTRRQTREQHLSLIHLTIHCKHFCLLFAGPLGPVSLEVLVLRGDCFHQVTYSSHEMEASAAPIYVLGFFLPLNQQVENNVLVLVGEIDPNCQREIELLFYDGGKEDISGIQGIHWSDF